MIRALGAPSLAALALLVGGGRQENGADHEHASVLDVKILGKRDRHRWRDLDGDGRLDLLVVSRFDRPLAASLPPIVAPLVPLRVTAGVGRRIEVVWNGPSGLDVEKRTTFAVPASARCFAIADVLPESGLDLVLLDAGGARAVPLSPSDRGVQGASRYRRVAVERSFFEFPPEGELPEWGLTLGPAGRRRGALILPTPEGFRVWRLTAAEGDGPPAKLEPAELLRFQPSVEAESSNNRRFAVVKTVPRPILRDVDGDTHVDFVMSDLTGASQWIVYPGRPGGTFSTEPVARPAPGIRRELKSDQLTYETADALDLNEDGICDLVISHTEGNIGLWDTLTTSQLIYYGRKGPSGFDTRPDQVVSSVGVSMIPKSLDFDGDGRRDLLVSSYRTDLLSNAKNAIFNSARISYFLFIMEDGRFPKNATVERNVDVDFKLIEKGGVEPRAYFDGDYDGDGVKDLLAIEEEDRVRAYRGIPRKASFLERGGFEFETGPMMELRLHPTNDVDIVRLDVKGGYSVAFADSVVIRVASHRP